MIPSSHRGVIYRVVDSPTEFEYAVLDAGGWQFYGSTKRARLFHGDDLPVRVVTRDEFNLFDV